MWRAGAVLLFYGCFPKKAQSHPTTLNIFNCDLAIFTREQATVPNLSDTPNYLYI